MDRRARSPRSVEVLPDRDQVDRECDGDNERHPERSTPHEHPDHSNRHDPREPRRLRLEIPEPGRHRPTRITSKLKVSAPARNALPLAKPNA